MILRGLMKVLALFGAAIAIHAVGEVPASVLRWARFEYPILVLFAAIGMMMMISANDLISLYMGLELQSLSLYVVAAINRDNAKSSEAGLKYFVLGALSSGTLLYGASLVYGFTGTTTFYWYCRSTACQRLQAWALPSALCLHLGRPCFQRYRQFPSTCGRRMSMKAHPHQSPRSSLRLQKWPRWRFSSVPWSGPSTIWFRIGSKSLLLISILSMALGRLSQLLVSKTISSGFWLIPQLATWALPLSGLAAGTQDGVSGVVIYMLIYMLTTLGVFACVLAMRRRWPCRLKPFQTLPDLGRTNKGLAFVFSMLMFSLAGIPPLAGFLWQTVRIHGCRESWPVGACQCWAFIASVVGAYLLPAHRQNYLLR